MATAVKHTHLDWAVRLICVALIAVLGYVLVRTIITLTNPQSVWDSPRIGSVATTNASAQKAQNFVFTTDPFNRSQAAVVEAMVEIGEDAPETTLNLTLTGRTAGPEGTAILRTPDNKEGNYRLGDEIVQGVTLQAVNKDFIVLDVDGQIQRLTFDRSEDTGLLIKAEDDVKTKLKVKVPSTQSASPQAMPSISADVSSLFQNISLRRVMKDGKMTGYSVKANRPGVDLTPFGFAKGDIVTAIGGTDITQGRPDFLALFEKAAQTGSTEVTVLRNGQTQIIKLGTP